MAADHRENNDPGKEVGKPAIDENELRRADDSAGLSCDEVPSPQTDEPRKVVKRPAIDSLAQFQASELYKNQFSVAEQMRKFVAGTAAEQMRKAMGGSIAEQMQSIVRNSLGEQIRQIEHSIRPLNTLRDTIGHLARRAVESPILQFLDDQASRHRQMMELLRPTWDQTLIGSALSDSVRAVQSLNAFHQVEAVHAQNAIRQMSSVVHLVESLRPKLPSFDQLSEFWLKYPARVKENLLALATAGWYLDPEMSITDVVHFKEDLENGTIEEVNDELVEHFRCSLERIEASLCEDHPNRAHLIKEAFEAHRDGKYSLSIPALFAQADGICLDLTGYQIFTGSGLSRFAKRIDPEALERAYLEPLLRTTPITESSRQRRAKIPQLNRHAVMHGESTDFQSEANGLKAVSFIHFVSHVLGMAVAWRDEVQAIPKAEQPPSALH